MLILSHMLIDLNQPGVVCVQQKVSGAGTFDAATPVGWGVLAYTSGGVVGRFRARERGVAGNACTIRLVDPGVALATSRMQVNGSAVTVFLKRSNVAITATALEVSTLLAGYDDASKASSGRVKSPILFGVTTDAVMTALSVTPLAGGIDAVFDAGIFKTAQTIDLNGGMINFNSPEAIEIVQVEGSAAITKVEIANVDDGFNVITGEKSDDTVRYLSRSLYLGGNQALLITMVAGTVRVWARRASLRQ